MLCKICLLKQKHVRATEMKIRDKHHPPPAAHEPQARMSQTEQQQICRSSSWKELPFTPTTYSKVTSQVFVFPSLCRWIWHCRCVPQEQTEQEGPIRDPLHLCRAFCGRLWRLGFLEPGPPLWDSQITGDLFGLGGRTNSNVLLSAPLTL